jgi:uncharacterized membrane protein YozB (DUF420 family)
VNDASGFLVQALTQLAQRLPEAIALLTGAVLILRTRASAPGRGMALAAVVTMFICLCIGTLAGMLPAYLMYSQAGTAETGQFLGLISVVYLGLSVIGALALCVLFFALNKAWKQPPLV